MMNSKSSIAIVRFRMNRTPPRIFSPPAPRKNGGTQLVPFIVNTFPDGLVIYANILVNILNVRVTVTTGDN